MKQLYGIDMEKSQYSKTIDTVSYTHLCPLAGDAFQLWMRGQGLTAASYLLDLMQRYTSASPVYLLSLIHISKAANAMRQSITNKYRMTKIGTSMLAVISGIA